MIAFQRKIQAHEGQTSRESYGWFTRAGVHKVSWKLKRCRELKWRRWAFLWQTGGPFFIFSFMGSWSCFYLVWGITLKPLSDTIRKLLPGQCLRKNRKRRNRREGGQLSHQNQENLPSTVAEAQRVGRWGARGKRDLKYKNIPSVLKLGDSDRNTEHGKFRSGRGGKPLGNCPLEASRHLTGVGGAKLKLCSEHRPVKPSPGATATGWDQAKLAKQVETHKNVLWGGHKQNKPMAPLTAFSNFG